MKSLGIITANIADGPKRITSGLADPTAYLPAKRCFIQAIKAGSADNVTRVYIEKRNHNDPVPAKATGVGLLFRLEPGEVAELPIAVNESADLSNVYFEVDTDADAILVTYAG